MWVLSPPSASLSAGAITRANRSGVSGGTRIWRGVRAVSAARRPDRVPIAAIADMMRLLSGCLAEAVPGEVQVDVVEGGFAGADPRRGQAERVDRGDRLRGAAVAQRHGERRPHGKRLRAGDALGPQRGERGG